MDKRWTLGIVTLLMVLLVYSFLSMVLKTDRKKTVHSRMYRDYSTYQKKHDSGDYYYENKVYGSSGQTIRNKRTLFNKVMKGSFNSYNQYMEVIAKNSKGNHKSSSNPQYEQMMALSKQTLPEFQLAVINYQNGEYDDAVSKLNEALEKLDPLELKNRAVIYSLLAECYIKLKDSDGYIQNKIRYVRVQRKINKILKETYQQNTINDNVFLTTEEASTNLLRVKSSVAKLPDSPMVREMVKKAELDLEVARKVTQ